MTEHRMTKGDANLSYIEFYCPTCGRVDRVWLQAAHKQRLVKGDQTVKHSYATEGLELKVNIPDDEPLPDEIIRWQERHARKGR